MKYMKYRSRPKGTVETYYEDQSVVVKNTGLAIDTVTASVSSGRAVSIASQSFDSDRNEVAYQISYDSAGAAVVDVTTTFQGTLEKKINQYHHTVLDNSLPLQDYQ